MLKLVIKSIFLILPILVLFSCSKDSDTLEALCSFEDTFVNEFGVEPTKILQHPQWLIILFAGETKEDLGVAEIYQFETILNEYIFNYQASWLGAGNIFYFIQSNGKKIQYFYSWTCDAFQFCDYPQGIPCIKFTL